MEPWSREPVGRFDELEIESDVLRDNPLGDPHVRPLWVYLPPGYDAEPDRRLPSIYLIQGMTGQLDMWRNRTPYRPTTPERIDSLFAEDDCPRPIDDGSNAAALAPPPQSELEAISVTERTGWSSRPL